MRAAAARISSCAGLLLLSACSAEPAAPKVTASARVSWAHDGVLEIDGTRVGALRREASGWLLEDAAPLAELRVREAPLGGDAPYPRRVVREASFTDAGAAYVDAYTLLAPAAPLEIEGLGLVALEDAPGTNDADHARIRDWLAAQGLPPDTAPFEAIHAAETGRELRVWYEISGRRTDGTFSRAGSADSDARVDSLFRSEAGALKIHHKRPGENGRFTYHRKSLELADRIAAAGAPELVAHECGCYGYAIAADFTTLGPASYQVEADWLDDRVGAEFFVGFERRAAFPWLGLGDRRRMRDLARRARAFVLRDAQGVAFAEVALELPADPPPGSLGVIGYRFSHVRGEDERELLASALHTPEAVTLELHGAGLDEVLAELDRWLAAMPVQVVRGDGVRDSQLGEIELLVDAIRLLRAPDDERLADFASEVDAASAAQKVGALLAAEPARFAAAAEQLPPAPIAGPGVLRPTRSTARSSPPR